MQLAIAAGLAATAHAAAQDYSAQTIGGWTVAPSKDKKGCFLTRVYEGNGGTTLLLGLDADNTNHLSMLNDDWSIRPKDRVALNFRLSSGGYSKISAIGIESDGKKGFVTSFEAAFPAYFARSEFLHVSRGKTPVERLDLDGSGAAVAELRRCTVIFGKAAGKPRAVRIPKDPFAATPKDRVSE